MKKKRLNNRKQIIDAIDERNHTLEMDVKLAAQYEAELEELRMWFGSNDPAGITTEPKRIIWHGKYKRLGDCKREIEICKRALPRHHSILLHLKATLAAFDTIPMPFLADDSVQLA